MRARRLGAPTSLPWPQTGSLFLSDRAAGRVAPVRSGQAGTAPAPPPSRVGEPLGRCSTRSGGKEELGGLFTRSSEKEKDWERGGGGLLTGRRNGEGLGRGFSHSGKEESEGGGLSAVVRINGAGDVYPQR